MKDSRTPTLRQIKSSEKQPEAKGSAAKQAWDSDGELTARQTPSSKPGLPLEKKIKQEKRRRHVLTNEHNRLTFAVDEGEAKVKQLQESLKAKNLEPTNDNNEDARKQRIWQLENNKDKRKIKTKEAQEIQTAYQHIREHLQQEVQGMRTVLDQKQQAIAAGQAEVDRATKQFQSAVAADSALDSVVQMEDGTMRRKREMDSELCKLRAEEKELKRQMEAPGHPHPAGQSRQKEREIQEEEEKEEEANSGPVTDHQCFVVCGASQSDVKLVEDMEALREALGYTEVQELVNRVASQRATQEQLFAEVAQYEDLTRQEAKALAELELQYAELKFSAKPAATRLDKLGGQMQAELDQKVGRVQRLQAELKQSQDLLDAVKRGVNNLYFRMSRVSVEGLPSGSSTDCTDQLEDVRARLPTLLQRASEQKPEISGPDREKTLPSSAAAAKRWSAPHSARRPNAAAAGGSSPSGRRSPGGAERDADLAAGMIPLMK